MKWSSSNNYLKHFYCDPESKLLVGRLCTSKSRKLNTTNQKNIIAVHSRTWKKRKKNEEKKMEKEKPAAQKEHSTPGLFSIIYQSDTLTFLLMSGFICGF